MTVYRIADKLDEYQAISTCPDDVAVQLGDFDLFERILLQAAENDSLSDIWQDVEVQFTDVLHKNSLVPDVSLWIRTYLVLSPKAFDVLYQELKKGGEFLPVRCNGSQWYFYTTFQFGLEDKQKCIEKIEYGYRAGLEVLVFDEQDLEDKLIFKSKMEEAGTLYCTDKFKSLCEKYQFDSIRFSSSLTNPFG
ncbi:hypothetical protein R8N45_08395 [Vibrio sp. 1403]|uniref:hypothetical protein n=1 Tax=Vibrio TaxID=662 RepID=UPI001A8CF63B|nr:MULTISPECIES: hypothetical protein [Vibrio]MBO0197766.1 hypothetical protein [Vibrio alginolyticus]MDW3078541.1 hypothetical protein [Vibrio sp. 1403]BDR17601.1 hypothetical protein VspSTUT16_09470 [Vibrio sp. STUT-A16]